MTRAGLADRHLACWRLPGLQDVLPARGGSCGIGEAGWLAGSRCRRLPGLQDVLPAGGLRWHWRDRLVGRRCCRRLPGLQGILPARSGGIGELGCWLDGTTSSFDDHGPAHRISQLRSIRRAANHIVSRYKICHRRSQNATSGYGRSRPDMVKGGPGAKGHPEPRPALDSVGLVSRWPGQPLAGLRTTLVHPVSRASK